MNGFIAKTVTCVCLTGGLASIGGCAGYRDVVDPCWPERYNAMASAEVRESFAPQVNNGHVLDQTIWNYHFEKDRDGNGTAVLTAGGMEHLAYVARRRPHPDPILYLQTAYDLPYDPAIVASSFWGAAFRTLSSPPLAATRARLDRERIESIKAYLAEVTAGRDVMFQVAVHDPAEVGMSAVPVPAMIRDMYSGYRGNLVGGGQGGVGAVLPGLTPAPGGAAAGGVPAGGAPPR
jgi:hypothetical protein